MSDEHEQPWASLPSGIDHPYVEIIEALWRVGEPLSAMAVVDVLDGEVTMWEAADRLHALHVKRVVKPSAGKIGRGRSGEDRFDVPYRLVIAGTDDDDG